MIHPPSGDCEDALISPFSARQLALPIVRQPLSDEPEKEKSGMKSWVAAKMVSRERGTAARLERKVFVDIGCSFRFLGCKYRIYVHCTIRNKHCVSRLA